VRFLQGRGPESGTAIGFREPGQFSKSTPIMAIPEGSLALGICC